MGNKKVNIEELYRSHFEGFTGEPSPGMWTRIRYKLMWNEFFRFSLNTFNVYYVAAALLVTTGGIILISALNRPDISKTGASAEKSIIPEVISTPEESGITQSPDITSGRQIFRQGRQKQTRSVLRTGEMKKDQADSEKQTKTTGKADAETRVLPEAGILKEQGPQESEVPVQTEKLSVTADFEASSLSGCAPLAVSFTSRSVNARAHTWMFGDGGSSHDTNPGYVFDEPGEYFVTLKVTGADGNEYAASSKIMVYASPKAQFEVDKNISISGGQPVYFYNYSRDADYYEWDFGDHTRSNQPEPVHYYDSPGNYNVTLKVWTVNQCYDSVTALNAFSPAEEEILFPNAFTPNINGPVGGYYQINDPKNEVFYPVVTDEIIDYQLKIFNRSGVQIFESNDVHIGWDGYFKNQLAAQGVYIWKARGRFASGKTFVRSGDVTLIWVR